MTTDDEIKQAMAEVHNRIKMSQLRKDAELRSEVERFLQKVPKMIRDIADQGGKKVVLFQIEHPTEFHQSVSNHLTNLGFKVTFDYEPVEDATKIGVFTLWLQEWT